MDSARSSYVRASNLNAAPPRIVALSVAAIDNASTCLTQSSVPMSKGKSLPNSTRSALQEDTKNSSARRSCTMVSNRSLSSDACGGVFSRARGSALTCQPDQLVPIRRDFRLLGEFLAACYTTLRASPRLTRSKHTGCVQHGKHKGWRTVRQDCF
jgi:hypothetical protein